MLAKMEELLKLGLWLKSQRSHFNTLSYYELRGKGNKNGKPENWSSGPLWY